MRLRFLATCALLLLAAIAHSAERPNVLLIMADDLGYSDLGCYGGEIDTPHLNSLANNGLRFTQFYNTARCWPTRAVLMTGYYAQQVRRDTIPGIPSGGRGKRPKWAPLVSARLKTAGYRTYHSGKWHLDGMPIGTGFDRSYYLRDQGRFFSPQVHFEDDKKLPPVKRGTGFYGTDAIADHAIRCLKDHAESHADKPFFHYLAFTAPHFPLHAKPEDIERFRERYKAGWDVVRGQRWNRIKHMGLASKLSDVERDIGPPYHFPDHLKILGDNEVNRPVPWNDLTESQQEFQATKMAIHAAMVYRMDQWIGRVIEQLNRMDATKNTLIMFLSDNGASAEIMVRSDGHDPKAPAGSAASYLCLGPGWSTVCNTPFRRHKTWVHEGGCCTPFVVQWPAKLKPNAELRNNPAHAIDVVPTILDACGVDFAKPTDDAPPPPGKSLLPAFKADGTVKHEALWWLHEGNRALRMGDWKLVAAKDEAWELYNLKTDRTETINLAAKHPDRVKQMSAIWNERLQSFVKLAKRDLP